MQNRAANISESKRARTETQRETKSFVHLTKPPTIQPEKNITHRINSCYGPVIAKKNDRTVLRLVDLAVIVIIENLDGT